MMMMMMMMMTMIKQVIEITRTLTLFFISFLHNAEATMRLQFEGFPWVFALLLWAEHLPMS